MGAVGHNGTFTADGDRVTLLEAIAKAGDLTSKARVDRVAVIREMDGGRQIFMHDLRSREIFDSPCFYLQQTTSSMWRWTRNTTAETPRAGAGRSDARCCPS